MPDPLDHPFFSELKSFGFPVSDYALAGSAPLYALGLIDDPSDLDVVARGKAWAMAIAAGTPEPAPFGDVKRVQLAGGHVEVLNGWFPTIWSTDEIIDTATTVGGFRFVRLEIIRQSKLLLRRPRDLKHLQLLNNYLRR
ncbi:hypothetical protein [Crossiella sp. NPDC003009]